MDQILRRLPKMYSFLHNKKVTLKRVTKKCILLFNLSIIYIWRKNLTRYEGGSLCKAIVP